MNNEIWIVKVEKSPNEALEILRFCYEECEIKYLTCCSEMNLDTAIIVFERIQKNYKELSYEGLHVQ